MDSKDLQSSGDESDADFVPKAEDDNSDTGSEVSDFETSEGESNSCKSSKRKKRSKRGSKKAKTSKKEQENEDDETVEEKREINVDALWADFKKDVNSLETKKTAETSFNSSPRESENSSHKPNENSAETKTLKAKPKGVFSLANINKASGGGGGGGGGGLTKILSQIKKVDKMSTLQKSQLDWNNFKKSEGIEEEIKMYNRGKDGYLEKQDFLQRTDLRQFEIEKDLRSARRKF